MITGLRGVVQLDLDDAAELADVLDAACRVTRPNPKVDHIRRQLRRTVDKLAPAQGNSPPNLSARKSGVQSEPDPAQAVDHDRLVDSAEAAKLLRITPAGVRYLAGKGRLPAQRAGGRWLYPARAVVARAEQQAAKRAG